MIIEAWIQVINAQQVTRPRLVSASYSWFDRRCDIEKLEKYEVAKRHDIHLDVCSIFDAQQHVQVRMQLYVCRSIGGIITSKVSRQQVWTQRDRLYQLNDDSHVNADAVYYQQHESGVMEKSSETNDPIKASSWSLADKWKLQPGHARQQIQCRCLGNVKLFVSDWNHGLSS